jgi:hypothetical protein
LGQAFVLASELDPAIRHLHVHYLHTPASVVRYACLLSGRTFSFSAHAKDIWTTPAMVAAPEAGVVVAPLPSANRVKPTARPAATNAGTDDDIK